MAIPPPPTIARTLLEVSPMLLDCLFTSVMYGVAARSIEYPDAPPTAECVRGFIYPSAIVCNRIPESVHREVLLFLKLPNSIAVGQCNNLMGGACYC